ncbi:MAG: DNA-binding NarL/FixJ family response regulator [Sphingobacteriales bacterium]
MSIRLGGAPMSPAIARKVITHFRPQKKGLTTQVLTPKELEVVTGLVDGKLIASRLAVSIDAVRAHIRNIYFKLQVNSKAELIFKSFKGEL